MQVLTDRLNTEQAAAIIGCSGAHVRRMLIDGDLRGEKISERCWIVKLSDAQDMAETRHATGRPRKS